MLRTLAIANYRSLRNLIVPLQGLNLITGPNGSGKSSVYRALRLLAETAQGGVIPSLAREGGLQSTLWAGPEKIGRAVKRGDYQVEGTVRQERVNLRLGFAGDEFGYAIDLGLPPPDKSPNKSLFALDPEIKTECIWAGPILRPASLLVERKHWVVRTRGGDGGWAVLTHDLSSFDSMMAQFADPRNAPEMFTLREQIRSWRFYDHFRTDAEAPARLPQIGTHTPILSNNGADLAAALQTIREIGDAAALAKAVDDAFPRSSIDVLNIEGRFEISMHQHGLLRPLKAAELSDGTLRYLLWIAALLTPRPPSLLVLNEPETSLHPDLLPPLGRLIANAAERSQVLVVTHAAKLIAALEQQEECNSLRLEKRFGETNIVGRGEFDAPAWRWASR
ncbi:MAG TPA: AAA family ATPase [Pyrinomonadaceae bacterium]|nr:AAA family ATPase [Pyrinomonadaceae bacterium]